MAKEEAEGDDGASLKTSIVVARKPQPPAEDQGSIRTRSFVIASFWAIILLLGLPVWWWTTSIHRARLPLQEMLDWADGKVRIAGGSFSSRRNADNCLL